MKQSWYEIWVKYGNTSHNKNNTWTVCIFCIYIYCMCKERLWCYGMVWVAKYKTAVTPVLMHRSYRSLALSHWYKTAPSTIFKSSSTRSHLKLDECTEQIWQSHQRMISSVDRDENIYELNSRMIATLCRIQVITFHAGLTNGDFRSHINESLSKTATTDTPYLTYEGEIWDVLQWVHQPINNCKSISA